MIFKNVTKAYRPHFALGFIKTSVENAIKCDDLETYRHEMGKIFLMFKEYDKAVEEEREYTGIF